MRLIEVRRRTAELILGRVLIAFSFFVLLYGFVDFDRYQIPSNVEIAKTDVAVVFGGGESRFNSALDLLEKGLISYAFISGDDFKAYPGGPLHFLLNRNPDLRRRRYVECCIEWDETASNTIENAFDIACWVRRKKNVVRLLLITSRSHVPRALTLLSRELPNIDILPFPVDDEKGLEAADSEGRVREYLKYLFTVISPSKHPYLLCNA